MAYNKLLLGAIIQNCRKRTVNVLKAQLLASYQRQKSLFKVVQLALTKLWLIFYKQLING